MTVRTGVLLLAASLAAGVAGGATYTQTRLEPGPAWPAGCQIGWWCALDGDIGVAESGDALLTGVIIYHRNGTTWTEEAVVTYNNGAFATTQYDAGLVAVSGETVVVGVPYGPDGPPEIRGVHVYTRDGGSWNEQDFVSQAEVGAQLSFGYAVAIDGDYMLVGQPYNVGPPEGPGKVYAFKRVSGEWTHTQTITPDDSGTNDLFGWSIDIDGDTAVIGANWHETSGPLACCGAAYAFVRVGDTWTQQEQLPIETPKALAFFGCDVAISGDTAIVGARQDDGVIFNAGAAYVFVRSGTTWSQQAKLTASDGDQQHLFGLSVDIEGDTAVIGAPQADGQMGSAYIFTRSGTTWSEDWLESSPRVDNSYFGRGVAISGGEIMAGAWVENAVYFFSPGVVPPNQIPVADAGATTPSSGPAPLLVHFDSSLSSDPDGDPLTYSWELGAQILSTSDAFDHTFGPEGPLPASHDVTLTVTDTAGAYDSVTITIDVDLPADTDTDGLPDYWEDLYYDGADPTKLDSSLPDSDSNSTSDADEDHDGDGLTNFQEYLNGTNPLLGDTDGDQMPDGWEVQYGLDPTTDDALLDADGDTLGNHLEYQIGTEPDNTDSDGDNLPDEWEYQYYDAGDPTKLDPASADSDSNSTSDADEDDDGDGHTNYEEYLGDSDPGDPNSTPPVALPSEGGGGRGCAAGANSEFPLASVLAFAVACLMLRRGTRRLLLQ